MSARSIGSRWMTAVALAVWLGLGSAGCGTPASSTENPAFGKAAGISGGRVPQTSGVSDMGSAAAGVPGLTGASGSSSVTSGLAGKSGSSGNTGATAGMGHATAGMSGPTGVSGSSAVAGKGDVGGAAADSGDAGGGDDPGARDENGPCKELDLFCFDVFDMFTINPECFTCNNGDGCMDCVDFQAI